jgi:hypothetical protein
MVVSYLTMVMSIEGLRFLCTRVYDVNMWLFIALPNVYALLTLGSDMLLCYMISICESWRLSFQVWGHGVEM